MKSSTYILKLQHSLLTLPLLSLAVNCNGFAVRLQDCLHQASLEKWCKIATNWEQDSCYMIVYTVFIESISCFYKYTNHKSG